MQPFITFLLGLVKLAGIKLPLIWPYLVHIAADLAEIAKILGVDTVNPSFQETAKTAELKSLCEAEACDCDELVLVGSALDAAVEAE